MSAPRWPAGPAGSTPVRSMSGGHELGPELAAHARRDRRRSDLGAGPLSVAPEGLLAGIAGLFSHTATYGENSCEPARMNKHDTESSTEPKAGANDEKRTSTASTEASTRDSSARSSMPMLRSSTVPALDATLRRQAEQAIVHEGGYSPSAPPPVKSILRTKTVGALPSGIAKQEVDELARSIKE